MICYIPSTVDMIVSSINFFQHFVRNQHVRTVAIFAKGVYVWMLYKNQCVFGSFVVLFTCYLLIENGFLLFPGLTIIKLLPIFESNFMLHSWFYFDKCCSA